MIVSPMAEQVNRLVGNLLAGGAGVFLPGVGTLFTERRPAERLSKRTIAPPCRVVAFSSQQRGVSLVDEIARVAGCDAAAAQDIYDRWLSRVKTEDTLTLEGVGTLKFKNFTLDKSFDERLNPQGHTPVRIRPVRRFDWVLWMGVAAILVAVGVVGYQYWSDYELQTEQIAIVAEQVAEPLVEQIPADKPDSAVTTQTSAADTVAQATPADVPADRSSAGQPITSQVETPQATTQPAGTPAAPAAFMSGRLYVVLGVFSTADNAARAVADAAVKEPALRCGVYRFGEKLLVSPFESADAEACTRFIRERADRFPGMWTYTAR